MIRLVLSAAFLACAPAFAAAPTAHPAGHETAPPDDGSKAMDHADHCGLPMGDGVVTTLDVGKSRVTIDHNPIPALGWNRMVMAFAVEKGVDLSPFGVGERVHFLLTPDKKAKSQNIAAMCAADAETGAHEACMAAMHKTAMKIASGAGRPCAMEGMDHGAMGHEPAKAAGDHSHH